MATFEIDGKTIEAQQGEMIIQAADRAGIYIPRYCYHKKLSIAANCRMCLVQIGEGKKAMPACATPVGEGMKVHTKSAVAIKAQKAIMEFLLINHPLDCPICDQGGQCELQDLAISYGQNDSRYQQTKRVVNDENIGPLVQTFLTRCIQCTRCVRFGEEIAGMPELGMHYRGEKSMIATAVDNLLQSEIAGNVIDVCPVGALTAKPSRYTSRPWEVQQLPSIAGHDCLGSNINMHVRRGQVMKVAPRENEQVNEVWISDRDRFSYQGLLSSDRLAKPQIKQEGQWREVDWFTALEFATQGLQKVLNQHGADQLAGLSSPNASVEEHYLLQKLLRGVGCHNIDHRIRQTDFRDQDQQAMAPKLPISIADITQLDGLLLVGSNPCQEQPLLQVRLHKMHNNGGKLMAITPYCTDNHLPYAQVNLASDMVTELAGVAKAVGAKADCLDAIDVTDKQRALADQLLAGEKTAIFLGQLALHHHDAAVLRYLANLIAEKTAASVAELSDGSNSAGAWLAGAVPHRHEAAKADKQAGLNAQQCFEQQLRAYILMNIEPKLDCALPHQARVALQRADFVLALSAYQATDITEFADVILPIAPFSETSGTYVNCQGDWQSTAASCQPYGDTRPAWKVLRVLGNMLKIDNFNYTSSEQVRDELADAINASAPISTAHWQPSNAIVNATQLQRVAPWSLYRSDNVVRRATALQQVSQARAEIIMNPQQAQQLQLQVGDVAEVKQAHCHAQLTVAVSEKVALGSLVIHSGFVETADLGAPSGTIEVKRVN